MEGEEKEVETVERELKRRARKLLVIAHSLSTMTGLGCGIFSDFHLFRALWRFTNLSPTSRMGLKDEALVRFINKSGSSSWSLIFVIVLGCIMNVYSWVSARYLSGDCVALNGLFFSLSQAPGIIENPKLGWFSSQIFAQRFSKEFVSLFMEITHRRVNNSSPESRSRSSE